MPLLFGSDAVRDSKAGLQSSLRVGEGDVRLRLPGQRASGRFHLPVIGTPPPVRLSQLPVAASRRPWPANQPHRCSLLGRRDLRPPRWPFPAQRTCRLPPRGRREGGWCRLPRCDGVPRPGSGGFRCLREAVPRLRYVEGPGTSGTQQTHLLVGD